MNMDPTMQAGPPVGGAPPPPQQGGGGLEMFLTPLGMQLLSPPEQQALGQAFGQKIQQMQQGGPQGPPPGVLPPGGMGGGMPPPSDDPRAQMARALGGM